MEKFIFISYAHKDSQRVLPVIQTLQENGFRIWYDEGIDPGTEWDKNIASHITDCSYFIAFISKAYLESSNCKDEINFARDLEKKRFLVYIEDVELPQEMKMRLSRIQNIFMHKYSDKKMFYQKLFAAEGIEVCRDASYTETATSKMPTSAPVHTTAAPATYKQKTSPWVIALVILLAIVIIGGGFLFFLGQKNTDDSNQNPTTAPTPTENVQPTVPLTDTPTPEPTKAPTNTPAPVDTPTPVPTEEPDFTPTPEPTKAPTNTPTPKPTNTPTPIPHVHSFDSDYVCTSCGESGHTEGLEYKLNDAETYYIVTGIGSASGKEVIIPSEYKGLPVREIEKEAFKGLSKLTKVVIPKTIKKIGRQAFYNTVALTEIEFNAIECADCDYYSIFYRAGQDNNGIKLTVGADVTRIPAYLFHPLDSKLDNYVNISSVSFAGTSVKEIGQSAFYGCKKLTSIALPEGLKSIGQNAFYSTSKLAKLVIPSSVTSIGHKAFENTVGLTKIEFNAVECSDCSYAGVYGVFSSAGQESDGIALTIGKDVTRIPAYLFYPVDGKETNFANITSLSFSGTKVTEIGKYAFYRCKELSFAYLPEGLKTIGGYAFFGASKLAELVIPSTVKSIGHKAFENTVGLTKIEFNAVECSDCSYAGVYGVFSSAGQESNGIALTVGKDVTRIPAYLFHPADGKDYNFANIVLVSFKGTNVNEIGTNAFYYCTKLTNITLPEGLKSIKRNAFGKCSSLTSVSFEEPFTWYAGSTIIPEFGDPQTAATALTTTYAGKDLKKE